MHHQPALFAAILLTGSVCLAQPAPPEALAKAIEKLAESGNYTWKSTMESSQWNPAPTVGKTVKDGPTLVTRAFGDNTVQSVHLGEKAASETQDGWRSLAELEADDSQGPSRWTALMLRNFETPAAQAARLLKGAADLALADGVYTGKLSEDTVKSMLTFRRRGGEGGPEVRDPSGSVRFWVKAGVLTKYETTLKGSMTWNDNDVDMDRKTTVEISEVGTTRVEVPAAAKEKLN